MPLSMMSVWSCEKGIEEQTLCQSLSVIEHSIPIYLHANHRAQLKISAWEYKKQDGPGVNLASNNIQYWKQHWSG